MTLTFEVRNIDDTVHLDHFSFGGEVLAVLEEITRKPIAYLDVSTLDRSAKSIEIYEMEVINKGKGWGTQIIKNIKTYYTELETIRGQATEYSKSFWSKFTGDFYDTCTFCPLDSTDECPLSISGEVCDEYTEHHLTIRLY